MPRRALRCCVELSIHAVSAPGVWLPSKEDVYLSISLLDSHRITRLQTSVFPLLIHEQFSFQKTYYSALDPAEVSDYLEDEVVVIELLQLSEYRDGAVRLASYSAFARDFLFPFPSLAPTYSSTDRELLLTRSVAFPGISPKLEFATKTVIKESLSPELDALEDALDQERGRRTSRRSRSPARRPRSTSLSRRITDLSLSDSVDSRPPFVVRKLETDLIGRVPGGGPDAHGKSRGRKPKSLSASRDDLDLDILSRRYSLDKDKSKFDSLEDEDAEVSALTSRPLSSYSRPRPRSASPVLARPSFRARYGLSPYYPYYPYYSSAYADYLKRRAEDYRLARLTDPLYPYYPYYSPYRRYYYDTLLDLELSTSLAKSRRYLY
ncbi:uncharacterized protein LOC143279715 [Babylonia areolata]|uniref:uncharacterized protein LOC143279715 n=1 Tax=Babylonia areolata TaxID=304850 RepID=UPI003FD36F7F